MGKIKKILILKNISLFFHNNFFIISFDSLKLHISLKGFSMKKVLALLVVLGLTSVFASDANKTEKKAEKKAEKPAKKAEKNATK